MEWRLDFHAPSAKGRRLDFQRKETGFENTKSWPTATPDTSVGMT